MDLQQVDAFDAQPRETAVHGGCQVGAVQPQRAAPEPGHCCGASHLGGHRHSAHAPGLTQPAAEEAL
jgi:hypothetical protein